MTKQIVTFSLESSFSFPVLTQIYNIIFPLFSLWSYQMLSESEKQRMTKLEDLSKNVDSIHWYTSRLISDRICVLYSTFILKDPAPELSVFDISTIGMIPCQIMSCLLLQLQMYLKWYENWKRGLLPEVYWLQSGYSKAIASLTVKLKFEQTQLENLTSNLFFSF